MPSARTSVRASSPPAVGALLQRCTAAWYACADSAPVTLATRTRREQKQCESALDRFVSEITLEAEHPPRSRLEQEAAQRRGLSALAAFARDGLDLDEEHVQALTESGFVRVGAEFARAARHYDPGITAEEIYQATRNVWTMVGLQRLTGQSVALTPSVFAYSLLYPYTDNFLDDPEVSGELKTKFNARFARRLAGEPVAPEGDFEERIYDLVDMIEEQYARDDYPGVYESLLAIHSAQVRSVRLLARTASPYEVDVLGISLEKGGASVLADGYLVAGHLEADQAAFLFNYGALLQLVDDLQDAEEDARRGLATIYSQTAAGHWPLDAITERTFRFAAWVMEGLGTFDAPGTEALRDLIRESAYWLLTDAVGRSRQLFTKAYLRAAEQHSPFRFDFLRAQRQRVERRRPAMQRLVDAMTTVREATPPPPPEATD